MRLLLSILLSYALLAFPLHAGGKKWIPWKNASTTIYEAFTGVTIGSSIEAPQGRGMKITIGAAPITVTEVGLWGHSEHVGLTSLDCVIYTSGGTELGRATVSWGTSSQFYYATLGTPIVLSASTTYYVISEDLSYYKCYNATVTPQSHFSVVDAADEIGGGISNAGLGANNVQFPVSFKYHL